MNVFMQLKKFISAKVLAGFFMASVALFMVAPVTLQIKEIEFQNKTSHHVQVNNNVVYAVGKDNGTAAPEICDGWLKTIKSPAMCGFVWLLWAVFWVSAQFVKFAGWILDIILSYTLESFTYNNQQGWITQGWALLRDFINVFFIMILLTIAGNMLVNKGGDTWKKQLVSIAIAAVLINFSLFFVKVVIDGGNITARVFYRAMDLQENTIPEVKGSTAKISGTAFPTKVRSITSEIIVKTNAMNLLSSIGGDGKNLEAMSADWIITIIYLLIGIILFVFMTYMFLNIAFYFFARTIGLWFLMVLSPLAFLASVNIPWLKKIFDAPAMKEVGWESYTSNLVKMAFQPAVFLFMMYLTIVALNLFVFAVPAAQTGLSFASDDNFFITIIYWVIPLMVVFGLIIATKKATDKFSTTFGDFIASGAKSVVGAVGTLALGGAGLAARATLGAAVAGSKTLGKGAGLARMARMNMATGKGSYVGNKWMLAKGNAMKGMKEYGKKGSWDARDLGKKLGGFKKYGEKVGLKMDTGLDFENTKIFGKDYLDIGKIPLGKAYNIGSLIKEGREGGLDKHGAGIEAYYQKLADEIKKDKEEQLAFDMKKAKEALKEKEDNMKDQKKDIVDIAFNGNEKAFNTFNTENSKMRNAIDALDGGFSDNGSMDFSKKAIDNTIDLYRVDPQKHPLSKVISDILEIEKDQENMFMLEEREVRAMPAGEEHDNRLFKLTKAKTEFKKFINESKAKIAGEFAARVTTDPVDAATDSDDTKKENKRIREEKAKLDVVDTNLFKNKRDGGVIDDEYTIGTNKLTPINNLMDKKIREEEIRLQSGSLVKKQQQIRNIMELEQQVRDKRVDVTTVSRQISGYEDTKDATGAVVSMGLVSSAEKEVFDIKASIKIKEDEKRRIEEKIKGLGVKSILENDRRNLVKRNSDLDILLKATVDPIKLKTIEDEIAKNNISIGDLDTRIGTFDIETADLTNQKKNKENEIAEFGDKKDATGKVIKGKITEAEEKLIEINKQKSILMKSKEAVEKEEVDLIKKTQDIYTARSKAEERYDKYLGIKFGKDKDTMKEQLAEYEKANNDYKQANTVVKKQEEHLREEIKKEFKDIKSYAQKEKYEFNTLSRQLSEVATLGVFRAGAEVLGAGSRAVDEIKGNEGDKYTKDREEFLDRMRGLEVNKDGEKVPAGYNKINMKIAEDEKKDNKKKGGDKKDEKKKELEKDKDKKDDTKK